jgi:hypothetical protein
MSNAQGQCLHQAQAQDAAAATNAGDQVFDPNAAAAQYTAQQMEEMWNAQQSEGANGSGDWDNTQETHQFYTNLLQLAPVLGWPGSAASAMSAFVSSGDASLSSALEGYAVLDSACSHRSVFNDLRAFPNGVSTDSSVVVVDSNGRRKAAPGVGAAAITSFPLMSSPIDVTFPEAVYNPDCPVNLICLSNILKTKDGTKKDNDVSFKRLTIDLNIHDTETHRTIPIEELNGLFVIKIAFLAAVAGAHSE